MTATHRIRVGGVHAYDIVIAPGAHAQLSDAQWPIKAKQLLLVSDTNVAPIYAATVQAQLQFAGYEVALHVIEAGEQSKNLASFESVIQSLAALGARRDDCIVALGGGVVGDLAGFAAACWMRGIHFIQLPTSLLAMVDSSVGGKTGIDIPAGKNLLGAFHFPRAVVIDPEVLTTLPLRERAAGFAEVIKYGALGDAGFFTWLESQASALCALEPIATARAIAACCQMKADIVEADPFERGKRALLNFGHTFGHAIEAAQAFGGLNHGEAVAIGMCCAAKLSESLFGAPVQDRQRLERLLAQFALPTRIPAELDPAELLAHMRLDKKADRNGLRFIVWDGIGQARIAEGIADADVLAAMKAD
jgi:3-dehydroquinate synthase